MVFYTLSSVNDAYNFDLCFIEQDLYDKTLKVSSILNRMDTQLFAYIHYHATSQLSIRSSFRFNGLITRNIESR